MPEGFVLAKWSNVQRDERREMTMSTAAEVTQMDPLNDALRQMDGTDLERAYFTGYALGWLAAFVEADFLRDVVTDAENSHTAAPYTYARAVERFAALGGGTRSMSTGMLWDSGALAGWKEATADRSDAEVCTGCDRRILTDDLTDAAYCERHLWLHDDCRADICKPGMFPRGCYS